MTQDEALERAKEIWGDTVNRVQVRGRKIDGEWYVILHNENQHKLDSEGHADCHPECKTLESDLSW